MADDVSALALRFGELFQGLNRAYGRYVINQRKYGGLKVEGRADTVREPVTPALWEAHLSGARGIGIIPVTDDATCWFGVIDVDQYPVDLVEVERRVAMANLPLLPFRSKSGGAHVAVFGAEPLPAKLLRQRLAEWASVLGYGGSEIFPKQNALLSEADVGNWINMPYFDCIEHDTARYGIYLGVPLTPDAFLERAHTIRITAEQLEALAVPQGEEFREAPPCLQSLGRTGFPEGSRNMGLFAVGVYLKKRFPDEWETRLFSYNVDYFKPPLSEIEVKSIQKSLKRKDYAYTCDKPPCKAVCNKALCRTREFGVGGSEEDWGITVDSHAQKILTTPPYWLVTVNGVRLQLDSQDLQYQGNFITHCIQHLNISPPRLKENQWREVVNGILKNATEVAAPADAGIAGDLEFHLQSFCLDFAKAETREEILTGRPFTEEGFVYFRSADFARYLESQHVRGIPKAMLYRHLRTFGVTHKQFRVGRRNINVWVAPEPQQEPVDIPAKDFAKEGDM